MGLRTSHLLHPHFDKRLYDGELASVALLLFKMVASMYKPFSVKALKLRFGDRPHERPVFQGHRKAANRTLSSKALAEDEWSAARQSA